MDKEHGEVLPRLREGKLQKKKKKKQKTILWKGRGESSKKSGIQKVITLISKDGEVIGEEIPDIKRICGLSSSGRSWLPRGPA